MNDWTADDVTTCAGCERTFASSQEYCPVCGYPQEVSAIGVPQSPVSRGLATPVDFGESSKPKISRNKVNKSKKNVRAKDFGYIRSLAEYQEEFKRSSGVEYRRYKYLYNLEQRGVISTLILQPEYELIPQNKVPANDIHPAFTSGHEIYTPDFSFVWFGYQVIEDAKGKKMADVTKKGKPTGEKRLTPYVKAPARSKHKALLFDISDTPNTVFILTVWHESRWHYFDANRKWFSFDLECE